MIRPSIDSYTFRRLESVSDNIDCFGFPMCDSTTDEIITEQKGVFRTNCLDWYAFSTLTRPSCAS